MTKLLFIFGFILFNISSAGAQVTAVPVCQSTGHRCINLDDCSTMANGQYQWCGGCQNQVRCQNNVGQLFEPFNPPYTQWDDNRKNFELDSTTCVECYYPCPPGPSAPPEPVCQKTGLGCVTNACPGFGTSDYQFCGNCSYYAACVGTTFTLTACPDGKHFDDFVRTCVDVSTTCRECYEPCSEPTTQIPTTTVEIPTTVEVTTQGEEVTTKGEAEATTKGSGEGEGGATTDGDSTQPNTASSLTTTTTSGVLASTGRSLVLTSMLSFVYALLL